MSTFSGLLEEFPHVSVDRFNGDNRLSRVFFLSHCHADHMVGLGGSTPQLPGPLYVSDVSKIFLKRKFPNIKDIHSLEINCPVQIFYEIDGIENCISVTFFNARHCPGSVMILFESKTHTILYTGDFRLQKNELSKILPQLKLDAIYLDSTFLLPEYQELPSPADSVDEICRLISKWLAVKPQNLVLFCMPANIGYEYLYISLANRLKMKIHVPEERFQEYSYIPELDNSITNATSRVQSIIKNNFITKDANTLVIKPSALRWQNWTKRMPLSEQIEPNVISVCYSTHSSLNEIKSLIDYLKPKKVALNVFSKTRKITLDNIFFCKNSDRCALEEETEQSRSFSLRNPFKPERKKTASTIENHEVFTLPKRTKQF